MNSVRTGFLSFCKFLMKMDVFRNNRSQKSKFIFFLFDQNGDAFLSRRQVADIAIASKRVIAKSNVYSTQQKRHKIKEVDRFAKKSSSQSKTSRKKVFSTIQKYLSNVNFIESAENFISDVFDELFYSFNFVIPRESQKQLVVSILKNQRRLNVGSKWAFIDKEWWEDWANYTNFGSKDLEKGQLVKKMASSQNLSETSNEETFYSKEISRSRSVASSNELSHTTQNLSSKHSAVYEDFLQTGFRDEKDKTDNEKSAVDQQTTFAEKEPLVRPTRLKHLILPRLDRQKMKDNFFPKPPLIAFSEGAFQCLDNSVLVPLAVKEKLAVIYGGDPSPSFCAVTEENKRFVDVEPKKWIFWSLNSKNVPRILAEIRMSDRRTASNLFSKFAKANEKNRPNAIFWVRKKVGISEKGETDSKWTLLPEATYTKKGANSETESQNRDSFYCEDSHFTDNDSVDQRFEAENVSAFEREQKGAFRFEKDWAELSEEKGDVSLKDLGISEDVLVETDKVYFSKVVRRILGLSEQLAFQNRKSGRPQNRKQMDFGQNRQNRRRFCYSSRSGKEEGAVRSAKKFGFFGRRSALWMHRFLLFL
ncbi:hypothetical protein MHBO_002070 [Bonamia ostreae]